MVDKPTKQSHEFYARRPSRRHAGARHAGGAVKTGVLYNARLGDNGNPLKGPGGRFLKADLRGYAGMEKCAGWGTE